VLAIVLAVVIENYASFPNSHFTPRSQISIWERTLEKLCFGALLVGRVKVGLFKKMPYVIPLPQRATLDRSNPRHCGPRTMCRRPNARLRLRVVMKPSFTQVNERDGRSSASFAERGAVVVREYMRANNTSPMGRLRDAPRSANEALLRQHEVYFQSSAIGLHANAKRSSLARRRQRGGRGREVETRRGREGR